MTSADRDRLAIALCCVVAALAYGGALRPGAVAVFVLPSVVIVAVVALLQSRRRGAGIATALAAMLALVLAAIANTAGGQTSGPIARSTFLAGIGTAVAVCWAPRLPPLLACVPVACVFGGALMLGAAGEERGVLVATVALLALSVPMLERSRLHARGLAWRGITPAVAALVGLAAHAGAGLQDALVDQPPRVFDSARAANRPVVAAPDTSAHVPGGALTWLLLVVALVALAVLVRLLVVAMTWRRLQRRLRAGTPEQSAVGAWAWALARLRGYGVPILPSLTPDALTRMSPAVATALGPTAQWANAAAFPAHPQVDADQSNAAWAAARSAVDARRDELSRVHRLLFAFQGELQPP
jgi:hypothetical protein